MQRNPLPDKDAAGLEYRVSPVAQYFVYDKDSQLITGRLTKGARVQLQYDDSHAPLGTQYCTLYLFRHIPSGQDQWSTEAGTPHANACPPLNRQKMWRGSEFQAVGRFWRHI